MIMTTDICDLDLFRAWIAKVDVLQNSSIERDVALVIAYREIYYPEDSVTSEEESEIVAMLNGERAMDEEQQKLRELLEEARQEDADLWMLAEEI